METTTPRPRKLLLIIILMVIFFGVGFTARDTLPLQHSLTGLGKSCNVVALDLHGCLSTYAMDPYNAGSFTGCDTITPSEEIVSYLMDAKDNDHVHAVLLDIDSSGGMPQAAVEIEAAIKDTGKPVIALIRGYGDSAAYWIASGAKTIIASRESDVGSIGVTSSYVDNSLQNEQSGLTYNSLSTGKFKDTGSPDKPLSAEEEAYIQRSLETSLENFIQAIVTNRGLPEEKVRALADGSSMLGEEALQNGLIDMIGTQREALEVLETEIGREPSLCWPQYDF
jgi:protease-4